MEDGVIRWPNGEDERLSGTMSLEVVGSTANGPSEIAVLIGAWRGTPGFMDQLSDVTQVALPAQERLAEVIRGFLSRNIGRFYIEALKQAVYELLAEAKLRQPAVRERSFSDSREDFFEQIRTADTGPGYNPDEEGYNQILITARRAVDGLPRSAKVKARMHQMLTFIHEAISGGEDDQRYSLDALAARLDVGRSTVHNDIQSLRASLTIHFQGNRPD